MSHFDVFAQYYEDLLRAQYRVSEIVQQYLPRGTIREDFLRDLVLKRKAGLKGKKGIVSNGSAQSGECDLIFYDHNSPITPLGDQVFIKPEHCKFILEVKSNATGNDFKKTNVNFGEIKSLDPNHLPLCGLFCYNTELKKKTVLNRFGYSYDRESEGWDYNPALQLKYPYIDFIICIASLEQEEDCIEKQFFLIEDESSGTFTLSLEYPIIKNFFAITDNM